MKYSVELSLSQDGGLMGCLVLLLVLCTSCTGVVVESPQLTVRTSQEETLFRLYILADDWHQLGLGYEREHCWATLEQADLGKSMWVITESDIEVYDWTGQSITLTAEASSRLKETFSGERELYRNLMEKAFVVTFEDDWLYGGIFLEIGSAMGIRYPVIYHEVYQSQIVFQLRPFHPISAKYQDIEASLKSLVEVEQVRDYFQKQDKLIE